MHGPDQSLLRNTLNLQEKNRNVPELQLNVFISTETEAEGMEEIEKPMQQRWASDRLIEVRKIKFQCLFKWKYWWHSMVDDFTSARFVGVMFYFY